MERGAQVEPPRHRPCGRPQLAQQHCAQLGVLPEEGLQAHPLRQAALPTAPLLAQQPGREGTCRDRAESSVKVPSTPWPVHRALPRPGSGPPGGGDCRDPSPLPLGTH